MSADISATSWSVLLLSSAGVLVGAWALCLGARVPRGHRASAAICLSLTFIVLSGLAAGATGHFDRVSLASAAGAWAVCGSMVALVARRRSPMADTSQPRSAANEALTRSAGGLALRVVFAALASVNVVVYGWRAVMAVRLAPLGHGTRAYQLITIARWVETGQLGRPFLALTRADLDAPVLAHVDGQPKNAELVGAWIGALTHSMAGVGLAQLIFVAWLAVATSGCARALGVRADLARIAGALVGLCPVVVAQGDQFSVDVARTAPIVAAFQFMVLAFPRDAVSPAAVRRVPLVLVGLAVGFGVGVAQSNVLFVPLLAVVFAGLVAGVLQRGRAAGVPGRPSAVPDLLRLAVFAVVPAALLAAYWYVRSWAYGAGPLGFVADGGSSLQDYGTASKSAAIAKGWWAAASHLGDPVRGEAIAGGLGLFWLCVGLPAVAILIIRLFDNPRAAMAVVLPLTAGTLVGPASYSTHFSIGLTVAGSVALVALLSAYAGRRPPAGRSLRVVAAVVAVVAVSSTVAVSDAWGATRLGNRAAAAPGRSTPTLRQLVTAVRSPADVRHRFSGDRESQTTARRIPRSSTIGFFADGLGDLSYDLLGTDRTNRLEVLGRTPSVEAVQAARRRGVRYLYLPMGSSLNAQVASLGFVTIGPVHLGSLIDMRPTDAAFAPTLPTAAEARGLLRAPVRAARTTPERTLAAIVGAHGSKGCTSAAHLAMARAWTTEDGHRMTATLCRYSTDLPADAIALDAYAHAGRWHETYRSESTLTGVRVRRHRGGLQFVIVIRLANQVEIVKGIAPRGGTKARLADLASACTVRLSDLPAA